MFKDFSFLNIDFIGVHLIIIGRRKNLKWSIHLINNSEKNEKVNVLVTIIYVTRPRFNH